MRSLIFLILIACATALKIGYQNYKVYQVKPTNQQDLQFLKHVEDNNPNVDFWTKLYKLPRPLNVMVSPDFQDEFETMLKKHQVDFKILIKDVERLLVEERLAQTRSSSISKRDISFDRYHRYDEIQDYLSKLATDYADLVTLKNYGTSYEKRNLTLVHISSTHGTNNRPKPIIFVDAGIHAREWIAPAQALYILHQILERPENRHLIENVDWVVIPLLNPDGYEYTHTTDRFWRKTRSKGQLCDGVDPNRNFDYHWMGPGSTSDECASTYAGPTAFSEPETLALSNVIKAYADRAKLYLTFHSAAQCLLYPWGYTADPPENVKELHSLAEAAEKAISAVNDTHFEIGSSYTTLSAASGSSRDWAYAVPGIKLSYTMELPPGGDKGFDLPPDRILGVVEEMFAGVAVFHKYIEKQYGQV